MKTAVVLFFFGLVSSALATTYYIDYASGSDSNSGTDKAHPLKNCPGMASFSGSIIAQAGDRFIFKGGVTWPRVCFPLALKGGTSLAGEEYYGVDPTWYSGGSWSRPIFDLQNSAGSSRGWPVMWDNKADYVYFDGFEVKNFYWNTNSGGYGCSVWNIYGSLGFVITNCYVHSWSHDTYANGCRDDFQIVLGNNISTTNCVIVSCTFDGSPNGSDSGAACYLWPVVLNSTIENMANGCLLGGGRHYRVSGCNIGPIDPSFDPGAHENSIEPIWGGDTIIDHNVIHGAVGVCMLIGTSTGDTSEVYDNLIYDSTPIPIQFDGRHGGGTAQIYNNTIYWGNTGGYAVTAGTPTPWTVTAYNNHVIGCQLGYTGSNLVQTTSAATAAGYTRGNLWQPISGASPTVHAGTDLTSSGLPGITLDLNGKVRSGKWDVGAYQYSSGGYTLTVVNGSGSGTYASNAVVTITANSVPGQTFTNWSATVQGLVANANANSTTVRMNANVTVTANYVTNQSVSLLGTGILIPADNAAITAPFAFTDGYILQSVETTDVALSGQAIFTFTVTNAGNYFVQAMVNAPAYGNNSFYVNIDGQPVDPTMIWDVPVTSGFQPENVGWRGNGTDTSDQFEPKVFSLSAGTHQLIIRGREMNTQLQSVTILSYDLQPPPGLHIVASSSP